MSDEPRLTNPRLTYDIQQYVIARRPSTGEILLGGLGALGVGQMWFTEAPWHAEYPGYDKAEIVEDPTAYRRLRRLF